MIKAFPLSKDEDTVDAMLNDTEEICNALGLKFFLVAGSCLGFYRDGGYIPWDTDIDIGVAASLEQYAELKDKLIERGYICRDLHHRGFGHALKKGFLLDVHRLDADRKECWLDQQFFKSFDIVIYKGKEYKVPYPIERYLEHSYGENWRTPDQSWK